MIEIKELYFFSTVDKSPYVWEPDTNVFGTVSASETATNIFTMQLKTSAVESFDCLISQFEYDVDIDFEQYNPFIDDTNAIYNYRLIIKVQNPNSEFSKTFSADIKKMISNNFSIVYKTSENLWFICYAEFQGNMKIENEIVQTIEFVANDVKEEIFIIDSLTWI